MDWHEERARAVAKHGEALERSRAAEAAKARALIQDFVAAAVQSGLEPTRLTALGYGGKTRYRTDVQGWYIHPNRQLAVGTDGEYYILAVPDSMAARLTGVKLTPDEPRLVIGRGGRDGESMPLEALLRKRLAQGAAE